MSHAIHPKPGILEISPYVGGASKIEGQTDAVKLSSNENPFGPSDAVKAAIKKATLNLHRYPSSDHAGLRLAMFTV